ncbi:hypothetical protein [Mycobacterium sp. URHB0044]|jgi:hypothetical protein|uniref:hypothetical protein n=1 Tax=Mycobacterium sp. URHB0044 TaxID=1380386 RepID=UPI0012DF633A|nr:hypothetical protein [Mycobacterium sp. URHB0044]
MPQRVTPLVVPAGAILESLDRADHVNGGPAAVGEASSHRLLAGAGRDAGLTRLITLGGFDAQLLRFVVTWRPYGGPPEDELFPAFGLTRAQVSDRIRELVTQDGGTTLHVDDAVLLVAAAETMGISISLTTRRVPTGTPRTPSNRQSPPTGLRPNRG